MSPYAPRNNENGASRLWGKENKTGSYSLASGSLALNIHLQPLGACIIFLPATLWSDSHMAYVVATPPPHGPVDEFGQHHLKSSQAI